MKKSAFKGRLLSSGLKHLGAQLAPAVPGAVAGLATSEASRYGMNSVLDGWDLPEVTGFGANINRGFNALVGGLASHPRTRGMVFPAGKSAVMPIAMTGAMQPATLVADRGARLVTNLADASGNAAETILKLKDQLVGEGSNKGVMDTIQDTIEKASIMFDPRIMAAIYAGIGIPWVGWELHKRKKQKERERQMYDQMSRQTMALEAMASKQASVGSAFRVVQRSVPKLLQKVNPRANISSRDSALSAWKKTRGGDDPFIKHISSILPVSKSRIAHLSPRGRDLYKTVRKGNRSRVLDSLSEFSTWGLTGALGGGGLTYMLAHPERLGLPAGGISNFFRRHGLAPER